MCDDKSATEPKESDDIEQEDINFPATKKKKCCVCGKVISPNADEPITFGRKSYCKKCYVERGLDVQQALQAQQEQKEKNLFWAYVRESYGMDDIPDWWVSQMEKFLKGGEAKSWGALRYTLWYVRNILVMPVSPEYGLAVIKKYYSEAAKHYGDTKKFTENNHKAKLLEVKNEVMSFSRKNESEKKHLINIEEL